MSLKTLPITPIYQGQTNGCGTASLAMALNYLAKNKNPQQTQPAFTQAALDKGNREMDSFSSPGMLARLARQKGFYVGQYNNATFPEIKDHIDKQHPLLAVYKTGPSFQELHYSVIHGYDETKADNPKLVLTNPARQFEATYKRAFDEFSRNAWGNIQVDGVATGLNRFILAFSNQNDLPPDRDVPQSVEVANVFNTVINELSKWFRPGAA